MYFFILFDTFLYFFILLEICPTLTPKFTYKKTFTISSTYLRYLKMANSKSTPTIALLLALNLVFFSLVSASGDWSKPNELGSAKTSYTCPIDALKFGVCANLLNDLVGAVIGTPSSEPCCPLIRGLVDLDAAVCLCTAIRPKVLGVNLNVPLSLNLVLNFCGKKVPVGFKCD